MIRTPVFLNKFAAAVTTAALVLGTVATLLITSPMARAAAPNWDVSGSYEAAFSYLGTDYMHDITLSQNGSGNVSGNGSSGTGSSTYLWVIDSGTVSGDTLTFTAHYTATVDATSPLTTMTVTGTIANDGSISGTWEDNYQGGSRSGTWHTTDGDANDIDGQGGDGDTTGKPTTKDQCKNGGWEGFGFKNQGQCIKYVNSQNDNDDKCDVSQNMIWHDDSDCDDNDNDNCDNNKSISWHDSDCDDNDNDNDNDCHWWNWDSNNKDCDHNNCDNDWNKNWDSNHNNDCDNEESGTSTVTIVKYVDGVHATAGNSDSTNFPFTATYQASNVLGGAQGSDPFTIGPVGNGTDNAYEAMTIPLANGAMYNATENTTGNNIVGASCEDDKPFALVGYSSGNTLQSAINGTKASTSPTFNNIQGNKYVVVWNETCDEDGQGGGGDNSATSTVRVIKYIDGVHATADNASSTSFGVFAQWSDPNGIGSSTGSFNLGTSGSYEAITSPLTSGEADYALNEILDGSNVGASCSQESNPEFRFVGYTTGNTLSEAQNGTPTGISPSFTDLQNNKYIIIWNERCDNDGQGGGGDDSAPTLTLIKHAMGGNGTFTFNLSGSTTAQRMLATSGGWATSSLITLGVGSTTISEVQNSGWNTTDISCVYDNQSIGVPLSSTSEEISVDEGDHVTCTIHNTATSSDAALHVDSIDAIKTTAVANDTYTDGWQYIFHITTPNSEENLSMRFSNWIGDNASNTIPVANNMRISSAQASSTSPITLTGSNIYSTPAMIMTSDLNPGLPGRQVDVLVEVKIPAGTANDNYTTTYGVQTLP